MSANFRLPPKLPERGRFKALYAWLNRLREAVAACAVQVPHNVRRTQSHQGVLLDGNFGSEPSDESDSGGFVPRWG